MDFINNYSDQTATGRFYSDASTYQPTSNPPRYPIPVQSNQTIFAQIPILTQSIGTSILTASEPANATIPEMESSWNRLFAFPSYLPVSDFQDNGLRISSTEETNRELPTRPVPPCQPVQYQCDGPLNPWPTTQHYFQMPQHTQLSRSQCDDLAGPSNDSHEVDSRSKPFRTVISTPAVLRAAERRRSNPHKFFCEYCSRGFTAKHNYDRHISAHKDDRPFLCGCGISFITKSDLRRHQARSKRHTPATPWSFSSAEPLAIESSPDLSADHRVSPYHMFP